MTAEQRSDRTGAALFQSEGKTEFNEAYRRDLKTARDSDDLCVLGAARQKSVTPFRTARESFHAYVMEYVLSGGGVFISRGREFALSPGMVFVYGMDIPHVYRNLPGSPFERYYVCAGGLRAKDILLDCAGTVSGAFSLTDTADVLASFESIFKIVRAGRDFADEMTLNCLKNLLLFIKLNRCESKRPSAPGGETFLRIKSELDEHFHEICSLSDLCSRLRLPEHSVSRCFKRFSGETPGRYLTARKTACASFLLSNSDMPLKEIAGYLRYRDVYSFARAFKKAAGEPPGALRRRADRSGDAD
jgi:AraC-like DNA-binding protein/mannose-6-phosphate isomerase-like protein (cupin superfamily)